MPDDVTDPVALMAATCSVPLVLVNEDGRIVAANPAAVELIDLDADVLVGQNAWAIVSTRTEPTQVGPRIAQGRALLPGERLYEDALGNRRRIVWSFDVVPRHLSGKSLVVATGVDVTRERMAEAQWRQRAQTDPLTGLSNRSSFEAALSEHAHPAHGMGCGILFCDLDGFKAINDTHGHAIGDEVLIAIGQRLAGSLRTDDTVSRLGGDEFAVLMPAAGMIEIRAQSTRIEQVVQRPVKTAIGIVRVGVSIGVALVRPGDDALRALHDADQAMYERKRSRKESGAGPGARGLAGGRAQVPRQAAVQHAPAAGA